MVTRVYNRVADRYDEDWSGIYANARTHCIRQIMDQLDTADRPLDVVDFGIGTGNALSDLRRFAQLGRCTGFDLSAGMLAQAERKLDGNVHLIRDDAIRAPDYLQAQSNDLALCHFLLSFVDADRLLDVAHGLLRPGGMLSLATSTQQSLHELTLGRYRRASKLLGVERMLRKSNVPVDHRHCQAMLQRHGFEIVAEHLQRQPLCFESFEDVRNWALNSGWIPAVLDDRTGLRIACGSAAIALVELFLYPLYPVRAATDISIVLARKPEARPKYHDRSVELDNRYRGPEGGLAATSTSPNSS